MGGASGGVKIVSLSKGDVLTTLQGHRFGDSVEALCFVDLVIGTGDGGKGLVCVSAGTDGRGFVWDVATGRVRSEIHHDVRYLSSQFILFAIDEHDRRL